MKNNKHSKRIPTEVSDQTAEKINETLALLQPYLLALTPAEKLELPKMGQKTLSFVEKAHDFAVENMNLVPPYLDMQEFNIDFADAHGLWTLCNRVKQLNDGLVDTQMIAGSEAYKAALVFYNSVKVAASQDVPGAKAVYEELKKRFSKIRRHNVETQIETDLGST